jgi:GT2 family glycosyltransferase
LYGSSPQLLKNALRSLDRSAAQISRSQAKEISVCVYVNGFPSSLKLQSYQAQFKTEYVKTSFVVQPLNLGFTGAVNRACQLSVFQRNPDWFVVLNDDVEVDTLFLKKVFRQMQHDKPELGSCGVRTTSGKLESFGLRYFQSGLAFPNRDPNYRPLTPQQTYICGTAFWMSSKIVQERMKVLYGAVLMPLFFAYHEDMELSYWVQKRHPGKVKILETTLLTHHGSQTAIRGSSKQLLLGFRNSIAMIVIHWTGRQIFLNLPWLIGGQLYIWALAFSKGYFLLPFRVLIGVWTRRQSLIFIRQRLQPFAS